MRIKNNTLVKVGFISFLLFVPLVTSNIAPYSNRYSLQTAVKGVNNITNIFTPNTYYLQENQTKFSLQVEIEVWNPTNSKKIIKVEKNEDDCFEIPFYLKISKLSHVKDDIIFDQLEIPINPESECIYDEEARNKKFTFERGITYIKTIYDNEFILPGNVTGIYGKLVFEFVFAELTTTSYNGTLFFNGELSPYFLSSPDLPLDNWGDIAISIYTIIIIIDLILIFFYIYKKKGKNI